MADTVEFGYTSSCLNILPRGLDKGKGLKFLAQKSGYRLDKMLGVGDSESDIPFLTLTGHSAAPANAHALLKQNVQYVSPYPTTRGVQDILQHFGLS